jgi:two-component system, chemotaxis family, CheB/CheR fusion protein
MNEKLRAELQASREELQAVNEELHTLNGELQVKVHEISQANSDLQNLMSSSDIGVVFLDRALNIKRFTPPVRQLINIIPSDIGRPLAHLTHRLETSELPALAAKVLHDLHTIEREVQSHAGQRYRVRLLPYRSVDDRIEGVVLTFIDVTDLRNAEAGLRDAEHRKDELLATLSHELRNPLTPLKVALDVLKLAAEPAQRASAIAIMDRQLQHLIALVDELLDRSRIARGQLKLERVPVDSAVVVESALEAVLPLIRQHDHQLHVELPRSPVRVLGDESRLVQVVVTLLTNAVKYTPDGGRIELRVAEVGDRLVIRVHDSGVGIDPDVLPRIFDLFVQSRDVLGRSRSRFGAGLDLVRRLVELHGGDVVATSAGADRGSEFVVQLPLLR